jgi:carbohydrate-selective porin OprB
LETDGLAFNGRLVTDASDALDGGVQDRGIVRELLDLNLTYDLKPLLNLEGGTVFAQFFSRQGPRGSDIAGDLQGFDNMDGKDFNQVEELWYEQKYFDGHLRTEIGQVDANAEFDNIGAAADFIHSSAGFSPTLLGIPTYPNPALSANLFAYPVDWFYWGGGVYTENLRDLSDYGFDHPYLITEAGLKFGPWRWLGPARVAAGFWENTGSVPRFGCGENDHTSGFYVVAEQTVWQRHPNGADDNQSVSVFAQYGRADPTVCAFEHQAGLGLGASGLLPGRKPDTTGVYWSWANTSRASASGFVRNEDAVELFYKYQATPCFSLKPDLQWIQNPGGRNSPGTALVVTIRIILIF